MRYALYILILVIFGGQKRVITPKPNGFDRARTTAGEGKDSLKLIELIADSTHIGRPRFNKIEISVYQNTDTSFVMLKFYSRQHKSWTLRQKLTFNRPDQASPDPHYTDFNNDGLKDLTYVSFLGLRGANEFRKLFIYDKTNDRLRYITNSDDFPNLYYNDELDCINAWMLHSGTSTAFLRLENNKLRKFAGVDLWGDGELEVYTVGRSGHEKTIRHVKHYHDSDRNSPFINFSPLRRG